MKSDAVFNSTQKIADKGISSNGTLGRVSKGETSVGIDVVELIADTFKLKPWQLLVPDMDPENPPALGGIHQAKEASFGKISRSIAALVEQIPDSDEEVKLKMLVAVSQIAREYELLHRPKQQETSQSKKPSVQPQERP
jgi:hypothetical protein